MASKRSDDISANPAGSTCVVCHGMRLQPLTAATGSMAYCQDCLHAWRTSKPALPYAETPMCAHDMGRDRYVSQVQFFEPFTPPGASVLEIGCATGDLATVANEILSISRYDAIELAAVPDKLAGKIDQLFTVPLIEAIASRQIKHDYDLVIISHVLEHMDDPGAELRAIRSILRPDGHIFIEVPNRSGNRFLPIDDNIFHMQFFSTSSLSRLLAQEGIDTIALRTGVRLDARCTDAMQLVAKPFVVPIWSPTLLSDHPRLQGESQFVVWGAGGLVENLLANYFDAGKIDFFVDRNGGKRNWQCLGREIKAPDSIGDRPRAILINSVDFADSIANDIKIMYPDIPHRVYFIGDLLTH